jgi:2-desacetyl-2-hydroxyethyl bacteriochlorophyllide A dehydrogenase
VGDRVVGECSVGCGACAACTAGSYHLCPDRTETGILNRPGALATTLVFPARSAHRVPSGVDPLDAALIEPLAVAYRALRRLSPIRSGPLAIVGAGTIGILCALAARAQGMGPILLIERDEARRRFAEYLGFGAAPALDAAGVRPGAAVRDRYDKVVDATGTESGIAAALRTAGDGGRVVVLGLCGRPALPVDLDSLVLRDLTVIGSLGSPGVWPEVIDLVATGQVTPSVIIGHRFTLNDAAEAFAHANGAGATTGKVIVYPQRGSHA